MTENSVKFNCIAIDFANEMGQEEEDEDMEEKENKAEQKEEVQESKAQASNKDILKELTENV